MTMMTGVVEAVTTKDVSTKFGTKPTFSLKVNGSWVKCGFKNPNAAVGDEVEFDGNTGTYGLETKAVNVLRKGANVVPSSKPQAAATPAKGSFGGYKEKVFPIPPLHGDRSIVRQNALARATELYIAARGGKPFDLDDTTIGLVIKFARKLEAYTAGDIDLLEAIEEQSVNDLQSPETA